MLNEVVRLPAEQAGEGFASVGAWKMLLGCMLSCAVLIVGTTISVILIPTVIARETVMTLTMPVAVAKRKMEKNLAKNDNFIKLVAVTTPSAASAVQSSLLRQGWS